MKTPIITPVPGETISFYPCRTDKAFKNLFRPKSSSVSKEDKKRKMELETPPVLVKPQKKHYIYDRLSNGEVVLTVEVRS